MGKPNFKVDLAKGQAGELLLLEMWPELVRLSGRHADYIAPDYTGLELKSDSYSMAKTANMFIERWSDVKAKKPGGPWQAFGRGSGYFAYMYMPDKTCFLFRTHELIAFLEPLIADKTLQSAVVRNIAWITLGYKVPRILVEHLVVRTLTYDEAALTNTVLNGQPLLKHIGEEK